MQVNGTKLLEMKREATQLFNDAETILLKPDATAEDKTKAADMVTEAKGITTDIENLMAIKAAAGSLEQVVLTEAKKQPEKPAHGFKSAGQFYQAVYNQKFNGHNDPRLKMHIAPDEPDTGAHSNNEGWQSKTLVESIGASGGFTVPIEQLNSLYMWEPDAATIQSRSTVIPMARRSLRIPVLNQTGTTSGQPHWWGGVLAKWTEEAGEKDETEPTFRQIELVAHKLATYTEAADELLEDSGQALEALLANSFRGAFDWYKEEAFLNGTGAGQPLGVIRANATISVARAAAGAIALADIVNMLQSFQGTNPVWVITQSALSQLMLLNGPAGNASYVFMPSAREGMPGTLFGYPVIFNEHCPVLGAAGDIGLYDFKKYLVGVSKETTIDTSKHYKFRNDITSWRAVARVDGQPWLSSPLTYSDGSTQVSPFVILGTTIST